MDENNEFKSYLTDLVEITLRSRIKAKPRCIAAMGRLWRAIQAWDGIRSQLRHRSLLRIAERNSRELRSLIRQTESFVINGKLYIKHKSRE